MGSSSNFDSKKIWFRWSSSRDFKIIGFMLFKRGWIIFMYSIFSNNKCEIFEIIQTENTWKRQCY